MGEALIGVADRRLEVRMSGPPPTDRPTIVFLHPGLGCVSTWRDFPVRLAEACDCGALVYSRAGHGRSDPVEVSLDADFMHREALEVLPELVRLLGLQEFVFFGQSDGGSISLIAAGSRVVEGLRGVVSEAAHVFCEEETVRSAEAAIRSFEVGDLRRMLYLHHQENTDWVFRTWSDVWTDPSFMEWNLEELLPRIEVPVLVIQGAEDEYGTRAQVDAIERGVPETETLWLEDSGHSPHRDDPEVVLERSAAFIRRVLA